MEGVKVPPAKKIQPQDLEAFCIAAMRKAGLGEEDARLTAQVLVTTDTWGTYTHGSRQIRGLLRNARRGRLNLQAREEVVAEGPSWAIVDARDGMPPAISHRSMQRAIQKAGGERPGLRGSQAQQPLRCGGILRQHGRGGEHAGAVDVQRRTLHDRTGGAGQGPGHEPHRLCRPGGPGALRNAGYRHQRRGGHQNICRQERGQIHSTGLAGGRRWGSDDGSGQLPPRRARSCPWPATKAMASQSWWRF